VDIVEEKAFNQPDMPKVVDSTSESVPLSAEQNSVRGSQSIGRINHGKDTLLDRQVLHHRSIETNPTKKYKPGVQENLARREQRSKGKKCGRASICGHGRQKSH
jgi:hypothetical protein